MNNKTGLVAALAALVVHTGAPLTADTPELHAIQERCACHYEAGDMTALRVELDILGTDHPCADYILRLLMSGEPEACLAPYQG